MFTNGNIWLKSLLMEANRFIDFKRSDFDLAKALKPKFIAFWTLI